MKGVSIVVNLVLALLLSPINLALADSIVDNDSPGFTTVGPWYSSTLVPGYYADNYRWAYGGMGEARAEWTFHIPSDGYYQVFAWWSSPYWTRSPDAPYTVHHANGTTTVDVDQRINGSQWNSLGTFYFLSGEARVTLTNNADGNPVADAVRLVESTSLAANFEASPLSGFEPLEVNFVDQSLGEIEAWLWDFGDGQTSIEQNPRHVYQNPGSYSVSLTAFDGEGEESTEIKNDYITVAPSDGVAYEFSWPLEEQDSFIIQGFGNERMEMEGYHAATDFATYRFDAEVRTVADGWVEHFDGFGNAVMIRHVLPNGETVYSWYNHLAYSPANDFTIGQFIPIGTVVGVAGETGWTPSGVHVHFEIKKTPDLNGGYIYDLTDHLNPYEFIFSRLTYNPNPPTRCSDGTPVGECSVTRPFHCIEGGYLVENSLLCGCANGVPQTDGTCSKTESGIIVDNGDSGFQSSANWQRTTEVMGFYGADYLTAYAGAGSATASWTPDIPQGGYYRVYGWWRDRFSLEPSTRATNAALTINHAGLQDQVIVDFTDYRKEWKYLGTFLFEEGTGNSVVLSSTPAGDIVADAFRFVPEKLPESAHPYSNNVDHTWTYTLGGNPSSISVTFDPQTSVENGYDFILVTDADGNEISGSPFTGGTLAGQTVIVLGPTVQIRLVTDYSTVRWGFRVTSVEATSAAAPIADFVASPVAGQAPLAVTFENRSAGDTDSFFWDFGDGGTSTQENPLHEYLSAGIYTVALEVVGPNGSDSETKTDLIVVREGEPFAQIIDNDAADLIMDGYWWYSSTLVPGYYGNNYRWANGGGGGAKVEWVFQLPFDGYYQVLAWWSTPYSTRSPDAPYTVHHANGTTTVDVDQRINGSQWNSLGTFYFISGEARVVLTNDAQGNPVADAVQIRYSHESG
jgi:PKD repeat protein